MKAETKGYSGCHNAAAATNDEVQQIFNSLPNPVWVIGLDYEILRINQAMSALLGMDWQEVRGKKCFEVCANPYCKTQMCSLMRIIEKKTPLELESEQALRNGKKVVYLINSSPYYNAQGELSGIIEDYTDLTELKRAEEEIYNLAYYDSLTKLPNRVYFSQQLSQELLKAGQKKKKLAVMFLDLDGFKAINDTYGHMMGDTLLQEFAARVKSLLKETDLVARWGGDEFTIYLPEVASVADIAEFAERLVKSMDEPFLGKDIELPVGVSIGISIFPEHGQDLDTLITKADLAMYYVKRNGKGNFHFYDSEQWEEFKSKLLLNNLVKNAAVNNQPELLSRQQLKFPEGNMFVLEALLGCNNSITRIILPKMFIIFHLLKKLI